MSHDSLFMCLMQVPHMYLSSRAVTRFMQLPLSLLATVPQKCWRKKRVDTLIHLFFAQLQISCIFFLRIQFSRTSISHTFIFRAALPVLAVNHHLSSHQSSLDLPKISCTRDWNALIAFFCHK